MPLNDDGDVIRGLGFVALYAAYMEEAVDECVEVLLRTDPTPDERIRRRPTSVKVEYCRAKLQALAPLSLELARFPDVLDFVAQLLERRNEAIHGRIYGQYGAPDQLRSGRVGVPDREITSAELYDLANELFEVLTPLMHASTFALARFLRERLA